MARNRGLFNFSANLEVKKNAPLDSRVVVNTLLELTEISTWADNENKVWLYDGIVVSVRENHGLYMLTNYDAVTAPTAYADMNNWVAVDASAAKIDVVDNLTSTDNTKALAASQGKVLSDKIEEVKNSLSSVYNYKGSVANFAALPTNAVSGDTYNVVAANGNIPAGTNYAWNGTEWDALGGSVDLSGYYTKAEVDNAIENADISDKLVEVNSKINANTEALNVLNGTEEITGSLANTLKVAKNYTDTQLTGYVEKVEGSSLISNEKLALIDTNATGIANLKTKVEANTAAIALNKTATETNAAAIKLLNGDINTTGSVLNIINTQINNALEWQTIE